MRMPHSGPLKFWDRWLVTVLLVASTFQVFAVAITYALPVATILIAVGWLTLILTYYLLRKLIVEKAIR